MLIVNKWAIRTEDYRIVNIPFEKTLKAVRCIKHHPDFAATRTTRFPD